RERNVAAWALVLCAADFFRKQYQTSERLHFIGVAPTSLERLDDREQLVECPDRKGRQLRIVGWHLRTTRRPIEPDADHSQRICSLYITLEVIAHHYSVRICGRRHAQLGKRVGKHA